MRYSDQSPISIFAARAYSFVTLCALTFAPAGLIAYVAALPGADSLYANMSFHVVAIGIATAEGLFISFVSWRCYLQSGEPFLRWLTLGFLGFTIIYAPHGAFTFMSHHNMWLFILYGPASRLAMAGLLVKASLVYGRSVIDSPERRHSGWRMWIAIFIVINIAVGVLAYSPIAGALWLRLSMEIGACGLSMFSCLILLSRRITQPLMHNYILATAFFAESSLSFVLAKVWNHQWWLAHIIFASGFLLVSYGVIRAFLTTGAFSTVYSYERILATLKDELQARTKAEQEIADRERKLIEAHATVVLAAEVAHLGVWSWTVADNSVQWNPQMYKLFAQPETLSGEALNYEFWRSRLHPEDVGVTEALLMRAVEGKGQFDTVFRIVWPDGSIRYLQAGAFVERDASGIPSRLIGINFDITDNKKFESNLLEAKQEAEQASVTKGQFLANMSHEIRTPMNAVLGMLQLLRLTALDTRQADYATKAQTAARSLLGLLNDILDFSKIDAGKMELDRHPFNLENLVRDLAVVLSGNLGEKNIELVFEIDPTLPCVLIGDQLRLQQILINLAGNAIKFTQEGQVVISLTGLARDHEKIAMHIAVSDSGIGISPEQMSRIFDGFTQAEASTTRRFGGTGLGLVISKRLVSLMGGELRIDSALGKGSRFWFDINLDVDDATPVAMPGGGFKHRILVVDDHDIAREILVKTIETFGWDVDSASGGKQAVAKVAEASERGLAFDAVIMDWNMPDLDGVSAAALIQHQATHSNPPVVIMVTAFDREKLREQTAKEEAPFVDILAKPITPQQLFDTIQRALGNAVIQKLPVTSAMQMPKRLQGMRILVVEDNALNRQVVYELLSGEGAAVTMAEGGVAGVAMATQQAGMFDIVIMDVQMPDIDGLEATRRIRTDDRFQSLPILAMTANASSSDRDECLQAGMNEHVGKPIDLNEVVPMLLALTRQGMSATAEASELDDSQDDFIEPFATVLKRLGGRRDLYRIVLKGFGPECERLLELLRRHAQSGTGQDIASTLHNLKGLAGTAGALALTRRVAELELLAMARPDAGGNTLLDSGIIFELSTLIRKTNEKLLRAFDEDDALTENRLI